MTNRAAKQPVIIPETSNLLLSTNFAGTTGTGSFASTFVLTGTDSETGLVWPDNDGDYETPLNILYANLFHFYSAPPETINAASWPTYYAGEIQAVTGPDGTSEKALYLEVKSQNAPNASQIELQLQRIINSTNTAAIGDLPHLYTSYWFKRPASVLTGMAVGDGLVQFDYKSGGGAAGSGWYGGDARLIQELYKAADGNGYLRTRFDRNANGQVSEGGTITNAPDGILPWTVSNFRYWQEINKTVPVPFGQWVKYEMYIYRHQKNGIVLSAINDQIVCAHVGRTMGEFGNYWGRLFPIIAYGTYAPNSLWACRLRFRDYPPAGSVLQIPAAEHIYKHAA